ncbi:hypothetical protein N7468_009336 [Penicillium chermesinum]|uniref:Uncharacterized protein n=1 Tax=Penicillium chermesinum TaxID=63820 RepID=A0A9W9NHU9_9EURO|nr:uncharacterized protein N7468_009336 [Penicillium chermesinum]KAJ5220132.1 hypothetical protein N7468_009336 [Penicillium chermesinum]KAJ6157579.1 hypothetical protein N7470_005171 [Penicillium chermesinum]
MRLASLAIVLISSVGLALPIQDIPRRAPASRTVLSGGSGSSSPQHVVITWPENNQASNVQDYIEREMDEMPFLRSNEKEYNFVASVHTPQMPDSDTGPAIGWSSYRVLLGEHKGEHDRDTGTEPHTAPGTGSPNVLEIIDRNKLGPQCLALTIFILVSIIYFILSMLGMAFKSCIKARYPPRGCDSVHLSGPERQLLAWTNIQWEMMMEKERHW